MKLKTTIAPRRNGDLPKIEADGKAITANDKGVYDVDDALGARLLATGNFTPADAKAEKAAKEIASKKAAEKPAAVLVNDDGEKVDLDALSREELIDFGMTIGLDLLESTLDKDGLIAEIMREASAE